MDLSFIEQVICEQFGFSWDSLYFAIPDIHSRADIACKIVSVLESLAANNVVFLGDFIDKREDPYETVKTIFEAMDRNPTWKSILGNHEDMALAEYQTGSSSLQDNSIFSICTEQEIKYCIERFSTLPVYIETEHLIFVHGGLWRSCKKNIADVPRYELLWSYGVHPGYSGKKIVRGHDIYQRPTETHNDIATQTAAWLDDRPFCISIIRDTPDEDKLVGWIEIYLDSSDQINLVINDAITEAKQKVCA